MGIKIKHTDPTLNSFSTDDLVVNVSEGSLFFKSNTELFRIKGDTLTTTVTESFGDELWHRTGNNLYYTSGSVGIGTTTPSKLLHVLGGSSDAVILLEKSTNAKIFISLAWSGWGKVSASRAVTRLLNTADNNKNLDLIL